MTAPPRSDTALEAVPPAVVCKLTAGVCRALGDGTRLRIVHALAQGDAPVNRLSAMLEMPQSSISRHLKVLRDCGLVTSRHEAVSVWYSLFDHRVIEALGLLRSVLGEVLDERAHLAASFTTHHPASVPGVDGAEA